MMKAIIIFLLISIKCNHLYGLITLFNCTFDNGLVDDCNFPAVLTVADTLDIDIGYTLTDGSITPPGRPLSDASSVFSPTDNGETCLFPYELNGWDMHFCLFQENTNDSTCPTKSGNQTCARGLYGYKTTADPLGFLDIYRSVQTIIVNSTDEELCLSFYYYFTNSLREPNITIVMSGQLNTSNSETIVNVTASGEDRWYYSQTTFIVLPDTYRLTLYFRRAPDVSDTTNFTFALDNISITTGSCFNAANGSATTDALAFFILLSEAVTASAISETHTTERDTTAQMIESVATSLKNETVAASTISETHTTERDTTAQMIESVATSSKSSTTVSILPTYTTSKTSTTTTPLRTTLTTHSTTTHSIRTTNSTIITTVELRRKLSSDDSSEAKAKKFHNEFDQSITYFEDLPNEVLCEIFDYRHQYCLCEEFPKPEF
ncbi:unnamed protein product [Rotaria socialis]|uniref:MAM domain-containing protein n=1 Tax=Rotaria socialis TaxID=392032 RepID=A0A821HRN4_9BILA|nr:unnamed protein product [Rotaria socialis]